MFALSRKEKHQLIQVTHLMRQLSDRESELSRLADPDKVNVDYISGKATARVECAVMIEKLFDLATH